MQVKHPDQVETIFGPVRRRQLLLAEDEGSDIGNIFALPADEYHSLTRADVLDHAHELRSLVLGVDLEREFLSQRHDRFYWTPAAFASQGFRGVEKLRFRQGGMLKVVIRRYEEVHQRARSLPAPDLERFFTAFAFASHAIGGIVFRGLLRVPQQHDLCRPSKLFGHALSKYSKPPTEFIYFLHDAITRASVWRKP